MNNINFKKKDISIIIIFMCAILLISGIFGFIYETIFYRFDLGYFVKRGTTVGPWIPIYAFGGVIIAIMTFKFKKKPLLVFSISTIVCGLLEFITGYLLYHISHIRLWNYNIEILNFGNIGGYICFRSVIFFGLSGLFLVYMVIPFINRIIKKYKKTVLLWTVSIPSLLFMLDFIYNSIIN